MDWEISRLIHKHHIIYSSIPSNHPVPLLHGLLSLRLPPFALFIESIKSYCYLLNQQHKDGVKAESPVRPMQNQLQMDLLKIELKKFYPPIPKLIKDSNPTHSPYVGIFAFLFHFTCYPWRNCLRNLPTNQPNLINLVQTHCSLCQSKLY
jgi:hypothetical protein